MSARARHVRQVRALPQGEFDPRNWWAPGTWSVEPAADAFARAPEFGRRFLAEASRRFPFLQADAVFLRWSTQPADVYAVFASGGDGIGIQVDPDLEYVIVWDRRVSAEFGDWNGDLVPQAIEFMASLIERGGL